MNDTQYSIAKHPILNEVVICFHQMNTEEKIDGLRVSELEDLIDFLTTCKDKMIRKNNEFYSDMLFASDRKNGAD